MTSTRPVILMRPGAANDRLVLRLAKDFDAVWVWPAFAITEPKDRALVEATFSRLDDFDMVLLTSPAAIDAAARFVKRWPAHMTVATVGAPSAAIVKKIWGETQKVVFPGTDSVNSGSEALLQLLKPQLPAHLLIVRAQDGRNWLKDQLCSLGVKVGVLAAYERRPLSLSAVQIEDLNLALTGQAPIIYLTSSQAVDVLLNAVSRVVGALDWVRGGTILTIHPRVQEKLQAAGFTDTHLISSDEETVVSAVCAQK